MKPPQWNAPLLLSFKVTMCTGCGGLKPCGFATYLELQPMEEATLQYRFKFDEGYDWTWGGKLPGLQSMGA